MKNDSFLNEMNIDMTIISEREVKKTTKKIKKKSNVYRKIDFKFRFAMTII